MVTAVRNRPSTHTETKMLAEVAHVECATCRTVLEEMRDAVMQGEDRDGWWREQFEESRQCVTNGRHVHITKP